MTGLRKGLAAALFVALAGPAMAGPSDAQRAAFIDAVEAVGCEVTGPEQAAQVVQATGFDDDLLDEIVGMLVQEGLAAIDQEIGGLQLLTPACESQAAMAGPTDEQRAAFIDAVEAVGCEVATPEQATQIEEATGFEDELLGEIVELLMDEELIRLDEDLGGLRLMTPACN